MEYGISFARKSEIASRRMKRSMQPLRSSFHISRLSSARACVSIHPGHKDFLESLQEQILMAIGFLRE
jgi:hypothetical protein